MIAYFKKQNKYFLAAGAIVSLILVLPLYKEWLPQQEFYMKAFYLAVPVFAGIAAGRIFSGWWAGKRLSKIETVLYQELNPGFPIVKDITPNMTNPRLYRTAKDIKA